MNLSTSGRSGAQNVLAFVTFAVTAASGVLGLAALYSASSLRMFAVLTIGIGIFGFVLMLAGVMIIPNLSSRGSMRANGWTWALISLAVATNCLLFLSFWLYLPSITILMALALADLLIKVNRRRAISSSIANGTSRIENSG